MGNLTVYNLGQLGVNADKDPIELEDGELTAALNFVPSSTGDGAIINRDGLVKFNTVAGADTSVGILGGIGVPLPLARRIYLAQLSGGGATWLTTTGGFATAATQATTPATAARVSSFYNAVSSLNGVTYGRIAANNGNAIVYASNNYTQSVTAPTMYIYDGSMDRPLFTVPTNPDAAVVSQAIMWVLANNGYIYFSVHDSGDNGGGGPSTFKGSVYQYTISTNTIKKLGATFATGFLPYTLCWSNDRLWAGVVTSAGESAAGKVYWIRPNVDATWTLDKTFGTDIFPTTMLSFGGELYTGTYSNASGSAVVQKRSTAGVWTTVDTAGGTSPTDENWYSAMIQFGASLYIGYFENGGSGARIIRKFDGSSWTTTKSSLNSVIYNGSFTDNSVLYFWTINGANTEAFLSTPNGSVWTDRITNITAGGNRASSAAAVIVS